MNKPKIFLSGGFKSNWQKRVIEQLGPNFEFYNPREHGLALSDQYTAWDIHHVKKCDILFAFMEETNPSGYGLAFELGLAYALNKTIILVDEKSRINPDFSRYFEIIHNSSNCIFENIEDGITFLQSFNPIPKAITNYDKYR